MASRLTWDAEVPRELSRSARDGSPMCLALVEIDDMKSFISANGAEGARRFLKAATAKWVEVLRASDLLARYTRDDFGVLLPGCDISKASTVINRLCAATPEGRTCSAGVTHWDESESAYALVERAEAALKQAQDDGRNRVVVLEAPLTASTDVSSPPQP
ncbi:MAG: GGDEF domain-containing protein [Actinomycetota bacterium]|nr:GGDEF domain-containing protein [Actinomycetota bacterium]